MIALLGILADIAQIIGLEPQFQQWLAKRRGLVVKYRFIEPAYGLEWPVVIEITNLSKEAVFVDWWGLYWEDRSFLWRRYNDALDVQSSKFKIDAESQVELPLPPDFANIFIGLTTERRPLFFTLKALHKNKPMHFFLFRPEKDSDKPTNFRFPNLLI